MKYAAIIVAACASPPALATVVQHLDCPPLVASPDDARAAINAAAATGCVHLSGVYTVRTPPEPAVGRRPYDMITLTGAVLYGDSAEDRIVFVGNAAGQDWHGIVLAGIAPAVYNLSIDTSALTGTNEQTHAIYALGPVVNPIVNEVTFDHPQRGLPSGDCIRLVGYPGTEVTGARLISNHYDHCDRSGVGAHSGVHDLQITDSTFADTGDQDIDGEGSGDNADWAIWRNTFLVGSKPQGGIAIELDGCTRCDISDNYFEGRGLYMYSSSNSTVAWNTIDLAQPGAIVEWLKDSHDNVLAHNTITREISAGAGPVVLLTPHGSGTPASTMIADNDITQATNADVISTIGVVGLDVERNTLTYTGARGLPVAAVLALGSTTTQTSGVLVAGNDVTGPLWAAVRVSASYAGTGSVTAIDNAATGPLQGLRCEGAVKGPVCSSRNAWPANVCSVATECP